MRQLRRAPAAQRGFSILELMVALVLGLLVVAAVFVSSAGMTVASRQQRAASVMTDDAVLALSLIRRDLLLAGYVHPVALQGDQFSPLESAMLSRPVFGCNNALETSDAPFASASCKPGSSGAEWGHAIEINFEASRRNVDLSGDDKLTDCQGVQLKEKGGAVPPDKATEETRLATSHRYFVAEHKPDPPSLFCSSAISDSEALVPNVQFLQISYGVSSGWQADQAATRRPVRYVDAEAFIPGANGSAAASWSDVVAVRLCVLMRSDEPVLDASETQTLAYVDCSGAAKTSEDKRLYRAYATTVALRNRIAYHAP